MVSFQISGIKCREDQTYDVSRSATGDARVTPTIDGYQESLSLTTDILFQSSTVHALGQRVFDGTMTVAELREYGDTGIGTFNAFDGEMVVLDGTVYQVPYNGQVRVADDQMLTPFATVTSFEPDVSIAISAETTQTDLQEQMMAQFGTKNIPYTVRIDGTFSSLTARSVDKQEKPYPSLGEIVAEENVFEFDSIQGTIVGFWIPPYMKGINIPGWHLHFVSADKTKGGHVKDFTISQGQAAIDSTGEGFIIQTSQTDDFNGADLGNDAESQDTTLSAPQK